MSTARWRESPTVIGQLTGNPAQYPFLQAVRLLQQIEHARRTSAQNRPLDLAQYTPPTREFIRFYSNQNLSFASSEITSLIQAGANDRDDHAGQWQMTVAFMGLTGMSGTLPYHYSEAILQQLKNKNYSFKDFLDLFNHRMVSLFYRASTKYRLPIQYEKSKLGALKNNRDDFTQALLSIIGLGTGQLTNRLLTNDEALINYSGLFSQSVRTSSGLRRMLSEHFGYHITIDEFQGQWQKLLPDLTSRLTSKQYPRGCNVQLGKNAKLGSRGWFMQGKIIINIGPLNLEQFKTLVPGSRKLAALKELVRFYVGIEQDFEINIMLNRSELSEHLTLGKKNRPILGWNSWFGAKHRTDSQRDTIKIRLSADN